MMKTFLYRVALIYIAATPLAYFFLGKSGELAAVMLLSGVMIAIFSRINDITEISVLNTFQAKLQKAIDETYATLEQIRNLAKIFATASLSNTARSGFWGGLEPDQKEEILQSTVTVLQQLGICKNEIQKITKDYHDCILVTYRQNLLGNQVLSNATQECNNAWHDLRKAPISPPIAPVILEGFFQKYMIIDAMLEKRIEGYRYYYEHHKFSDFDDFRISVTDYDKRWPLPAPKTEFIK